MFTLLPFFIAGFFYDAWPWGFLVGAFAGLIPIITQPGRYAHIWDRSKALYLQSALLSFALSGALHGGAMALANVLRWLWRTAW